LVKSGVIPIRVTKGFGLDILVYTTITGELSVGDMSATIRDPQALAALPAVDRVALSDQTVLGGDR
jgi:hypothetical protein